MKRLVLLIATIFLQGCSVFGVRTVEVLDYQVLEKNGNFDIRQYENYWVARTEVDGDYQKSTGQAFRLLFNYISGKNAQQEKIAMTGPVLQQEKGEKIAMTGPVIQQKRGKGWRMEFVLPAHYNKTQPPEPLDPEVSIADVTEMTEFHPDFSHRYGALASGIGRLGWSGNLLTREYGALVELGSVLTSATLTPDKPILDKEHPCDRCKMCSLVCPVEMIHPKASTQVTVAGVTETISQKRPNTCCWIGCTGYEGLAASQTWSNWSPYRLGRTLPREKQELDALCISLQKADPQMQNADNSFNNYRRAVFDPDWFYYTVCGFCRGVCAPRREERLANRKLIKDSGTVALRLDGSHRVTDENTVEMQTPFGLRVVVTSKELSKGRAETLRWPGQFPLDREVIKYLCQQFNSAGAKGRAAD